MTTREQLHKDVDAVPEDRLADVRLVVDPDAERKRKALLKRFVARFSDPASSGIDWDLLALADLRSVGSIDQAHAPHPCTAPAA
jgi:hypothetical protein